MLDSSSILNTFSCLFTILVKYFCNCIAWYTVLVNIWNYWLSSYIRSDNSTSHHLSYSESKRLVCNLYFPHYLGVEYFLAYHLDKSKYFSFVFYTIAQLIFPRMIKLLILTILMNITIINTISLSLLLFFVE